MDEINAGIKAYRAEKILLILVIFYSLLSGKKIIIVKNGEIDRKTAFFRFLPKSSILRQPHLNFVVVEELKE